MHVSRLIGLALAGCCALVAGCPSSSPKDTDMAGMMGDLSMGGPQPDLTDTRDLTAGPRPDLTDTRDLRKAADHTVIVGPGGDQTFMPKNLTIKAGETVEWKWDSDGHDVVSVDELHGPTGDFCSPDKNGVPDQHCDSGVMGDPPPAQKKGFVYDHTFKMGDAGMTFNYDCVFHQAMMNGTITVTN